MLMETGWWSLGEPETLPEKVGPVNDTPYKGTVSASTHRIGVGSYHRMSHVGHCIHKGIRRDSTGNMVRRRTTITYDR